MKAGHRRALRRLAQSLVRYRCSVCLDDARSPRVRPEGIECPWCGWIDASRTVVISRVTTRSGFRWDATLVDTKDALS